MEPLAVQVTPAMLAQVWVGGGRGQVAVCWVRNWGQVGGGRKVYAAGGPCFTTPAPPVPSPMYSYVGLSHDFGLWLSVVARWGVGWESGAPCHTALALSQYSRGGPHGAGLLTHTLLTA